MARWVSATPAMHSTTKLELSRNLFGPHPRGISIPNNYQKATISHKNFIPLTFLYIQPDNIANLALDGKI